MAEYSMSERKVLLQVARDAIAYSLKHHMHMRLDINKYAKHLLEQKACFVTLQINHNLRGCIGTLVAYQPLIVDVAHNASAAAFADPRFPGITETEFEQLSIHISILSKPELMHFESEDDLLRQIRPGVDGLILSDGQYEGTFLPSVWESLPDPKQFLTHLKMKAGLAPDYWSDTIKVERYTVELIEC
ncbi:MAG: AmmeMemoRadiSam system protein A [Gammaproteobacteria bacterium]|jgi:AmmeMemoRadiSam system protein A